MTPRTQRHFQSARLEERRAPLRHICSRLFSVPNGIFTRRFLDSGIGIVYKALPVLVFDRGMTIIIGSEFDMWKAIREVDT